MKHIHDHEFHKIMLMLIRLRCRGLEEEADLIKAQYLELRRLKDNR